ncbi:MAG TPA: DUF2946 family protein [Steroidobacteraceae bacterium]|nr:DUF2946 family protein [Steroidobacteraceae bacterium]
MTLSLQLPPRPRLALLVACALLLRGLIPEGFMPAAGAGGFIVELCPAAGLVPPPPAAQAARGAHPGHASHRSHDSGGVHHARCVFSTGASTAFAAALAASVPAAPLPARDGAPADDHHVPAILRAQSPRAPPLPA